MRLLKSLRPFILSEWFFVFILSAILISLAFIPFFYQQSQTPKNSVFFQVHNNPLDYPMFISEIIQAQRGRWTFLATFTSEPQVGTLVHPIYIIIGKIGGLFNLQAPFLYNFSRMLVGFILSFSIYYFIKTTFLSTSRSKDDICISKIKVKLAFFLALFSAGFAIISFENGKLKLIGSFLEWWTGGDVLRRAIFQPHAMMKNTLLLLILIWMGKLLTGGKIKYLLLSLPAASLLGLLDPMNTMTILILLALFGIYKGIAFLLILKSKNSKKELNNLIVCYLYLVIYAIFALVSLSYMNWVFEFTPWKAVKDWEAKNFYYINIWHYANHIGLTFYLGIPGLFLLFWKKRNIFSFFSLSLALGSLFLLTSGITQKLGLSTLRFFQTPAYIFLAIGSSELIITLFNKIKAHYLKLLTLIFVLLITIISIPSYIISFRNQFNEFQPWFWNIYPTKGYVNALMWLKNNSPLESVVLSNSLAGNIIPGISGNTVYVGHMVSTINYQQKDETVKKFLSGTMPENEARKLMKDGRIDFVILNWGEPERVEKNNYPFLKKVFQNEEASIYKVTL